MGRWREPSSLGTWKRNAAALLIAEPDMHGFAECSYLRGRDVRTWDLLRTASGSRDGPESLYLTVGCFHTLRAHVAVLCRT